MAPHTVLVVDDEPASLRAVQRALSAEHRVLLANSGPEGLRLLAAEPVSIIIADHRMPEMTGTEFLARCSALCPETIRILLTGYTDVETVIAAINDGQVYYYLTKPWAPHELQLVVRRGFERYQAEQERRRLLHELEQACAKARREAEQKGRLLTLAAHELGTPLHVLLNALDLLAAADLPEAAANWLETAQRNSAWLARGLAQMTAAARAGSNGLRLHRTAVRLPALWSALHDELRSRLATRAVALVAEFPGDLPVVDADERWLRHALASLVSNAVRFTPDGGQVSLRAEVEAGAVALAVRDSGIGIAPQHLEEIFEPFSAAGGDPFLHMSGSLAFGARGLGLGLAITRAIVAQHGGSLRVDSRPQAGSCFTMVLPLHATGVSGAKIE
ncbi:MAG: hybrid sensor histidine kinase/response regulator [Deltaproteobacteria bacterium]|nr:hybrid sensor histidine kinase/response regulator [Deltaproteobacteria bacterium]